MDKKLTDNDIKKALEEVLKLMLCDGDLQRSSTISKTLDYINRLEAEKKELQELVDDMGDYFPACIDCEGKTPLGERTDKCVYKLNNTNYCTKRGIATIFSIRNENRELKAENERLKDDNKYLEDRRWKELCVVKAEAYKEFAERVDDVFAEIESKIPKNKTVLKTLQVYKNIIQIVKKEMVGEDNG